MANKQLMQQTRTDLAKQRPEIEKMLPEHITADRFERVTLNALQNSPDLLECNRNSLFSSVMACASDGLIPDGREAALVKFKDSVAYMPMVSGLMKLARQSGEISNLTSGVVYESEYQQGLFRYWIDDEGEHLHHQPDLVSDDPGKPVAVYALARMHDGELYAETMRIADVEKVRQASRAKDSGPWRDWWEQMARKTAIRRLFKRLPRSTDRLDSAVQRDDQFYSYDRGVKDVDTGNAPTADQSVAALTDNGAESEQDSQEQHEPEQPEQQELDADQAGEANDDGEGEGAPW